MSYAFSRGWLERSESTEWVQVWSSYAFVLGFLLVFRTSNAYTRYWEGASILQQVRGEWYNAVSSVIAFSSRDDSKTREVREFQQCLVRLMSMLYCAALQQMSTNAPEEFEILNVAGIDKRSLEYLKTTTEKSEVILQWVQRLVVTGINTGVVPVPAPIVTRVFQELSRGIVTVQNARKIAEFLFPFPYAQMCCCMLIIYWFVTPVLCATLLEGWYWAGLLSGLSTLMLWSLYYIALEIEMPFGSDENDLPITLMQREMNESLWMLLEARSQHCPKFEFDPDRDQAFDVEPAVILSADDNRQRGSMAGKNFAHDHSVWRGSRLKTALTNEMRGRSRTTAHLTAMSPMQPVNSDRSRASSKKSTLRMQAAPSDGAESHSREPSLFTPSPKSHAAGAQPQFFPSEVQGGGGSGAAGREGQPGGAITTSVVSVGADMLDGERPPPVLHPLAAHSAPSPFLTAAAPGLSASPRCARQPSGRRHRPSAAVWEPGSQARQHSSSSSSSSSSSPSRGTTSSRLFCGSPTSPHRGNTAKAREVVRSWPQKGGAREMTHGLPVGAPAKQEAPCCATRSVG